MAEIEMYVICCGQCGTTFMIPKALDVRYRESHQSFFCPNGHTLSYPQQTDADKWKNAARLRQDEIDQLRVEKEKIAKENRKLKAAMKKEDAKKGDGKK